MTYATNLDQIIASLETILDRLRAAAPLDFPETAVSFDWQITSSGGTEDERTSAATDLCRRLLDIEASGRTGGSAFGSDLFGVDVGHVNVDIWTSVKSERERDLEAENERLRAGLAALRVPAVEQDPDALDQLAVAATDAGEVPDLAARIRDMADAFAEGAGSADDGPDPCPVGDPDCETGDDGSCHDGCEAPDEHTAASGLSQ